MPVKMKIRSCEERQRESTSSATRARVGSRSVARSALIASQRVTPRARFGDILTGAEAASKPMLGGLSEEFSIFVVEGLP